MNDDELWDNIKEFFNVKFKYKLTTIWELLLFIIGIIVALCFIIGFFVWFFSLII